MPVLDKDISFIGKSSKLHASTCKFPPPKYYPKIIYKTLLTNIGTQPANTQSHYNHAQKRVWLPLGVPEIWVPNLYISTLDFLRK